MTSSRHQSSSPVADEFEERYRNRNSEAIHAEALAAAYNEHREVREAALRACELHRLEKDRKKRLLRIAQGEKRVRILEEQAKDLRRLQEVEAQEKQAASVPTPIPTPPASVQPTSADPPTHQPPPVTAPVAQPQAQSIPAPDPFQKSQSAQAPTTPVPNSTQSTNPFQSTSQPQNQTTQQQTPNVFQSQAALSQNSFAQVQQPTAPLAPPVAPPKPDVATPAPIAITVSSSTGEYQLEGTGRYVEIHKKLKELRKYINDATLADKAFKTAAGNLRRGLRAPVGQMVKDKSKNREPARKIFMILEQSLTSVTSPGIDPSLFTVKTPNPVEGARHNGEMPALFIYLLNYLSKYVVAQFISEASTKPEIADPIGVVVAQIFSKPEFLWRGTSLIDILMAKMRMKCPALFGVRGNENTEGGRANLGWDRLEDGSFISEQVHLNRMVGLSAGYAAICLRDFSKAKNIKSPWHPYYYWQSMACILSTPPSLRSSTQYIVLRSMIEGYEDTFLKFYGAAALETLRHACVIFPKQAEASDSAISRRTAAVGGLEVLADKLFRDRGIQLRYD